MKALFDLMQRWTLAFIILFGASPMFPVLFQRAMGTKDDNAAYATVAFLAFSLAIFGLVVWWRKSGWFVQRPWRLSALATASAIGIMTAGSALLGMYNILDKKLYLILRDTPSLIFIGAALLFWFIDWQDAKKFGEGNRTN